MSYHAEVADPAAAIPVGGSMSPALDALSLRFVIWAQRTTGPALDIGCGEGIATRALLARGGHVVAVDPDEAALRRLLEHVPAEQSRRLKVRPGKLPDIDFKLANFAAIHAARVLHLLDPVSLEPSLRKFYRWLYPQGKLFVSLLTPTAACHARQITALDEGALRHHVSAVGFFVEDSTTYLPSWSGAQECCAVVARCSP